MTSAPVRTPPTQAEAPAEVAAEGLEWVEQRMLVDRSIQLIEAHQQPSGAYAASPTFSAYRGYSWFRDGAFIADAMSAAGSAEAASRFHDWAALVLTAHRTQINDIVVAADLGVPLPESEMLATRFTFDGLEGADDWQDFQLDGYGTWLWAVVSHAERHGLDLDRWIPAIELASSYLVSSWRRPCYDWWEEHSQHVHVSTLGCIGAGLDAVARSSHPSAAVRAAAMEAGAEIRRLVSTEGLVDGRMRKWLGSDDLDASLVSLIAPLGWIDAADPVARATIDAIAGSLAIDGGVHRYLGDTYYGGGQWPLLSCMLGLAYVRIGDRAEAARYLHWAAQAADEEGIPEQTTDHLLAPERRAEWIERWGQPAHPLVWSSAMFLRLALELGVTPSSLTPTSGDRTSGDAR